MSENETEPFHLDMDVVEDQLKAVSPEQLDELAKRVDAQAQKQRPPNYGNMDDAEFRAALRKAGL